MALRMPSPIEDISSYLYPTTLSLAGRLGGPHPFYVDGLVIGVYGGAAGRLLSKSATVEIIKKSTTSITIIRILLLFTAAPLPNIFPIHKSAKRKGEPPLPLELLALLYIALDVFPGIEYALGVPLLELLVGVAHLS